MAGDGGQGKRGGITKPRLLGALSSDSTGELDVLGHDRHPLGVNRAQVGVLEKAHQIRLRRFLEGADSRGLEPQISLEVLRDFPDETLERQFADQQLGRFLIPTDFPERDGSGSVAMRLLDTSGGRCALSGGFGRQLLPRSLASRRLTGRLLSTSHFLRSSSSSVLVVVVVVVVVVVIESTRKLERIKEPV